jgi:hypothetical protein
MKILLGDFHAKLWKGDIFKLIVRKDSPHQDSKDNDVENSEHMTKTT